MTIEIGCSPRDLLRLFDSNTISPGMTYEAPGGVTLELGQMFEKRGGLPDIQATAFIPVLATVGSTVALGLFTNWLYDRLKGDGKTRRMVSINRTIVEVTPEAITKVLKESIHIEERN